jgi:hypothetical protein
VAVTTGIANTVPGAAAQIVAELLIRVRRLFSFPKVKFLIQTFLNVPYNPDFPTVK